MKPTLTNCRAVSLLACLLSGFVTGTAVFAQYNLDIPDAVDKNAPLWIRYMQAGELVQKSGKTDLAKRYYLGSLAELERSGKIHGLGVVTMLEQNLASVYCVDLSKAKGDQNAKLKLREEQVAVLGRITKFNAAHKASKIVTDQYQHMYDQAAKALEKEKSGQPVGEGDNKTAIFPALNFR